MIVHIGGSVRGAGHDLDFLRVIADRVHEAGGQIALNWFEASNYKTQQNGGKKFKANWSEIVAENEKALKRSDAFIAEITTYRLYHGYEIANALHMGKPVLLASRTALDELAISGVNNPLLSIVKYSTAEELSMYIRDFLSSMSIPESMARIDIKPDMPLYEVLIQKAQQSGKTVNEIAEELIRQKATERLEG